MPHSGQRTHTPPCAGSDAPPARRFFSFSGEFNAHTANVDGTNLYNKCVDPPPGLKTAAAKTPVSWRSAGRANTLSFKLCFTLTRGRAENLTRAEGEDNLYVGQSVNFHVVHA